jgi:peptidoglycan/xylan/chitin deacetylase (PgdA/CDA1 family)
VLADLGIHATVFVVSDAVGRDPWWWSGADTVVTEGELRDIVAAGHRIGSHTRTHASLPDLDDAPLRDELAGSRARLEELTGQTVDLLAYPSVHHDARVRAAAGAAGYRAGFTFLNGRVAPGLDMYELPRLTMSDRQGSARLAFQLARPAW